MFKLIKSLIPWYLSPNCLIEIIPEMIKDNSNLETEIKEFKFGLEEIIYGLGVLLLLYTIRLYI